MSKKFAPAATYEQALLTAARKVATLQAKRRRYRKLLKEIDVDLRHEKKMLRALATRDDAPRPDVAPSRLFGGTVGYAYDATADAAKERDSEREPVETLDLDTPFDFTALDATTRGHK